MCHIDDLIIGATEIQDSDDGKEEIEEIHFWIYVFCRGKLSSRPLSTNSPRREAFRILRIAIQTLTNTE